MLEFEDGIRVEQVVFPVPPPLVFAAPFEIGLPRRTVRIGLLVAQEHLFCN